MSNALELQAASGRLSEHQSPTVPTKSLMQQLGPRRLGTPVSACWIVMQTISGCCRPSGRQSNETLLNGKAVTGPVVLRH